jgi:ribonuclease P protein subunit RPR2
MSSNPKKIALKRIRTLFSLAKEMISKDPELAQKYVATARKIAMATKVRLPREYKQQVCKHCKKFILPNINCRVRTQPRRESHLVITCLECGKHMRIPLKRRGKKGNVIT